MTTLSTSRKFKRVSVDALHMDCPVPPTTTTYEPVPHGRFYDMVASGIAHHGFINVGEDLRVTESGDEFFGTIKLRTPSQGNSPWDLSLGLRNTNNKRASAGIFLGTNVWVCDNLQFSAEHSFLRKHHAGTIHVLSMGVHSIMEKLKGYRQQQSSFIASLQQWLLTPSTRDHLLVDLLRTKAIKANDILPILSEFRGPSLDNPEAQYDSAWGLFNAVTWIGKDGFERNPETQAARSIKANAVFAKGEGWKAS